MKQLKVNHKHYALFIYTPYFDRQVREIARPAKLTYDLGDVVYIKEENALGVVLGCICESTGEVRTDMSGMQCFSQIEPATKEHFKIEGVRYCDRLYKEVFGGLELTIPDKEMKAAIKKFEKRINLSEMRLPFIQFAKEKTFTLKKTNHLYIAYSSEKDRLCEFDKKGDAVDFFTEIGFTLTK